MGQYTFAIVEVISLIFRHIFDSHFQNPFYDPGGEENERGTRYVQWGGGGGGE